MHIYLQHTDYRRHPHQLREELQPRTFTLSAFPCSSEPASSQDEAGHGPVDTGTALRSTVTSDSSDLAFQKGDVSWQQWRGM